SDRAKCVAYFGSGVANFGKGSFDEAEEDLLKCLEFCEKSGHFFWGAVATPYLGWIYFELENYQKALHFLNEGVLLLERSGAFFELSFIIKSLLAATRLLNGHKDIDLSELLEFYERTNIKQSKIHIAYNIGIILINIDDQHVIETEDWFLQMILACETSTMRIFLARFNALYSQYFKRHGKLPKAREHMSKAIEIMKECGADGWVEIYEKKLAEL
ncbi:MAG: tetratricopeptide repeat protein, partial [Anaerolineales bacterium]|nr:tetratricopeptide repeat protein [Anaerolineales bacterium]